MGLMYCCQYFTVKFRWGGGGGERGLGIPYPFNVFFNIQYLLKYVVSYPYNDDSGDVMLPMAL